MTFAARQHVVGSVGGPVASLGTFVLADVEEFEAGANLTFRTDGTIGLAGNGSSGASAWYTPTTAGIGSTYGIKFTLTSGAPWDVNLVSGLIYSMSSSRFVTWTADEAVKTATATVQVYFEGAVVASGNITVSIDGRAP
jgi:hypothetical protein